MDRQQQRPVKHRAEVLGSRPKISALDVLENALARCRREDMRTPEVFAALDYLKARASTKWPFDQFRQALERRGSASIARAITLFRPTLVFCSPLPLF
jgi:hypothetical protein